MAGPILFGQGLAQNWRSRFPVTAEDWEGHRALFTRLYIDENRSLREVMRIMKDNFGFAATTQMYKKRIARWGLYKNYKADEKTQIARLMQLCDAQGRDISRLTIRGRPALLHRVRRFLDRGKGRMRAGHHSAISNCIPTTGRTGGNAYPFLPTSCCESPSSTSTSSRTNIQESRQNRPPSLERPFSMLSEMSRVELVLRDAHRYLNKHFSEEWCLILPDNDSIQLDSITAPSCFPQTPIDFNTRRHMYACTLREMFCYAVELLQQSQSRRGWQLLHEASDMVRQVLSEPYGDLLRVLLLLFRDDDFANFPEIRQHVLCFFTQTSRILHGRDYPLSAFLLHIQDTEILLQSSSPVLELMTDMLNSYASPHAATWRVRLCLCDELRRQRRYEAAEAVALKLLEEYKDFCHPVQKHTRVTLRRLGGIYLDWGRENLAESTYEASLEKGYHDLEEDFPDDCAIFAFRGLASLYEKQGNYCRSEINLRAALEGALNEWGADSEQTMLYILKLEDVLQKQGKELSGWERRLKATLGDHV